MSTLAVENSDTCLSATSSPEDLLSAELLQHIDMQCGFWLAMIKVIETNNTALGTNKMVLYSVQEREQLLMMVDHMKELALSLGPRRRDDLLRLRTRLEQALAAYDDFAEKGVGFA